MNLTSYFFGSKTTETKEIQTDTKETNKNKTKIYLLYGAKVSCSIESSYVIGVFNDETLANKELNTINEKYQLKNNVGRSIIDKDTNIKEYNYQFFLVECDLNKNYQESIENVVYGKLPY